MKPPKRGRKLGSMEERTLGQNEVSTEPHEDRALLTDRTASAKLLRKQQIINMAARQRTKKIFGPVSEYKGLTVLYMLPGDIAFRVLCSVQSLVSHFNGEP